MVSNLSLSSKWEEIVVEGRQRKWWGQGFRCFRHDRCVSLKQPYLGPQDDNNKSLYPVQCQFLWLYYITWSWTALIASELLVLWCAAHHDLINEKKPLRWPLSLPKNSVTSGTFSQKDQILICCIWNFVKSSKKSPYICKNAWAILQKGLN